MIVIRNDVREYVRNVVTEKLTETGMLKGQ